MRRLIFLLFSHAAVGAAGFALGVYLLPILTAPASPDEAMLEEWAQSALFTADFTRDLPGSDFLHWGEGRVSITETQIIHEGALAPGPDYKLYPVPEFVSHEDEFLPIKNTALQIVAIKTFNGFLVDIPQGVNVTDYTTVLIWREAFSEFITAARYQ